MYGDIYGARLPFFVLRLSDNVSHLGVFFGLLSAFSAGATYVVIRFLGTAKAEFVGFVEAS